MSEVNDFDKCLMFFLQVIQFTFLLIIMLTIANDAGKYYWVLNSLIICPMCCCLVQSCRFADDSGKSGRANMLCISLA